MVSFFFGMGKGRWRSRKFLERRWCETSGGVWRHARPEKFEILESLKHYFLHFQFLSVIVFFKF